MWIAPDPSVAIISFSGALLLYEDLVENGPMLHIRPCYWSMVPRMKCSFNFKRHLDILKPDQLRWNCGSVGLGHGIDPDGLSAAIDFLAKYLPA